MAEPVTGTGTGFSGVDQLVSRVCPTWCLGNWLGSDSGSGFGVCGESERAELVGNALDSGIWEGLGI